ncbi:hypothetical protein A2V68_02695 [candidate division Kazan bacterium RBG_13_50_9]|uniref:Uncharacterized protein n=1 Tax=candidate division Kazan bacterium RBG_13_50_9 TaxID=1798535 RepID=A0A1F4NT17_UNCK3|nr:MAG: hypothetical protein A2V68_02695 [candidate division Kazan bacterium RBG_13_50_9]
MSKQSIMQDAELIQFLAPFFQNKNNTTDFIKMCLQRIRTRHMLLRTHWYAEIADGIEKVRASRPALRIIFLISLAEGVARLRLKRERDSDNAKSMISSFMSLMSDADKNQLKRDFRRALIKMPHHQLQFSGIVNILYDIRNRAVHGDDFYSFSLLDKNRKKEYVSEGYHDYGILTHGEWKISRRKGSKTSANKKVKVTLDIKMTYEELRAIFIRTAIANIKKCGKFN